MMEPLLAGWGWLLVTVVGFVALAATLAYATSQWRLRRLRREPGSVERAPGPAPKHTSPGDDDRRAA